MGGELDQGELVLERKDVDYGVRGRLKSIMPYKRISYIW
jgi:hypothetical protein